MANSANLKPCIQLFCLSVAVAIITSCASTGDRYPGEAGKGGRYPAAKAKSVPTAHVWQYLYSYGREDPGYATYSYVLVGRDENNQVSSSLYFELVKAIRGSTFSRDSLPEDVSKANFNLFLIPATRNRDSASHEPNYELSKLLLASLSTTSPLKFSRPGPYIITLYKPISFGKNDEVADIMYIDLTNLHPTAIPEVVRTYKGKIVDENLDGIEKLESLRLSLLNIALIVEDSIGFAQAAYAGLRRAFNE